MKNFLKKYMTEEQLSDVTAKYIADHPGATELPTYISKARLDEVISKKDAAEQLANQHAAKIKDMETAHAAALTAAKQEATTAKDAEIEALKKDFSVTEAIYGAKGRNVKAIKALIDPDKSIEDEIARLKKDEAYLFHSDNPADDIPDGTGKTGAGGKTDSDAEIAQMRKAVGI